MVVSRWLVTDLRSAKVSYTGRGRGNFSHTQSGFLSPGVPTQTHDSDPASSPQVSLNPLSRSAGIAAPVKTSLLPLDLVCMHTSVHVHEYVLVNVGAERLMRFIA